MADSFLKKLYGKSDAMFSLVHEFNMHPARYIHESRLPPWIGIPIFRKLTEKKRAQMNISRRILEEYGLADRFFHDFSEARRRFALIDGGGLERTVYLAGIGLNASRIRKTVEKDHLRELKRNIGERAYDFALTKAPFLLGRMTFSFCEQSEDEDLRSLSMRWGMKCLGICFAGEPEALVNRIMLKLPARLEFERFSDVFPEDRKRAWLILKKILAKEVGPQWELLFS